MADDNDMEVASRSCFGGQQYLGHSKCVLYYNLYERLDVLDVILEKDVGLVLQSKSRESSVSDADCRKHISPSLLESHFILA